MKRFDPPRAEGPVSRRWLLRGLCAGGVAALGGGVALFGGAERTVQTATRGMMGTTATILLHGVPRGRAEAAIAAAFARMEAVAARMSRYRAESDIGRINRQPGQWVPVAADTAGVVRKALAYARASDGAFDPALDRLSVLWGFHGGRAADLPPAHPAPGLLASWQGRRLYRSVEVGGAAPMVRVTDPIAGLDLGGIAKGYAVDTAVEELRHWGVRNALVEAGGDLFALGRSPEGGPWPVGVRHPRDATRLLATLHLRDEAAATSGDDARYFEVGGTRYGHLLDPRRAQPAGFVRSMTVRASSALAADALATAACALPPSAGAALLARLDARGWIAMDATGRLLHG